MYTFLKNFYLQFHVGRPTSKLYIHLHFLPGFLYFIFIFRSSVHLKFFLIGNANFIFHIVSLMSEKLWVPYFLSEKSCEQLSELYTQHCLGETRQNISSEGALLHYLLKNFLLQLNLRLVELYDFQRKPPAFPSHHLQVNRFLKGCTSDKSSKGENKKSSVV